MTSKHFIRIAATLKNIDNTPAKAKIVSELVGVFTDCNPRFDRKQFEEASAGIYTLTVKTREGWDKEGNHVQTFTSEETANAVARQELKWESCEQCTVVSPEGNTLFQADGSFA
jgi:hypothetical protein